MEQVGEFMYFAAVFATAIALVFAVAFLSVLLIFIVLERKEKKRMNAERLANYLEWVRSKHESDSDSSQD